MVVDIDASAIITATGKVHEVQMKGEVYMMGHPHDERLFTAVGIADGEVANVGVGPREHFAIRDIAVRPTYVPETNATFLYKHKEIYCEQAGELCDENLTI